LRKKRNVRRLNKKGKRMPGPIRIGIALLILGAIIVGLGTLWESQALTIYGFIVVVCGFFLYFASTFYLKRQQQP
jgi:membrane-bound ClpP family serine protease